MVRSLFRKAKEKYVEAQQERREQSERRAAYSVAVARLAEPGADIPAILAELPDGDAYSETALTQVNDRVFRQIAEVMLEDDLLDSTEERNMVAAATALGITDERMNAEFAPLLERMVIARVNDGRLPVLEDVRLQLKAGETAHLTTGASLMKWNPIREYQSGHNGFSFRIAKGVYYHTGRTKGRSVVVGEQIAVQDSGVLTVTSHRAVFSGSKKALQFEYRNLLDMEVYSDGIKLAVSNRQNASLLKLDAGGDVVAAVISAAAQRI